MNLLEVLKAGKKNIKRLKFPGTEQEIGLTVLTEAEIEESVFATELVFKAAEVNITSTSISMYNSELSTQMLFRALVDPLKTKKDGTYERIFKSPDELRSLITSAQKAILIGEYNNFENECSPDVDKLSQLKFDELFEELKKNPQAGNSLSLQTARRLILYLVGRLQSLPQANGSIF